MAYNFIRMRLTPYIIFGTLTMAYIFFKLHLAPDLFIGTLVMAYIERFMLT
jgi:multisubunit Na+/H+ antiporter MnhB subunit